MDYTLHGLTSLHEILGDSIVYRNLVPADERIPAVAELRGSLGLECTRLPRKSEPEYGLVVAEMLRHARALEAPGVAVQRLVYIGDTQLNDGTAFRNLCIAGNWPGWAFIGRDEAHNPLHAEVEGSMYVANRWSALDDFVAFLESNRFPLDQGTAVVVDVDKTAIGARGRNDRVIDRARVEAVRITVADLLGTRFDEAAFGSAYDELNKPAYHTFTTDNQDYLAYTCLILGAGLLNLETLVRDVESGSLTDFGDLIDQVEDRRSELAQSGLEPVHDAVRRGVQAGDPTPFKAFRFAEYGTTSARFGHLPGAPVEQVLAQCIVITQEVRQTALNLFRRGALVFGVSDKPDEASVPSEAESAAGLLPLHRLQTVAVGQA